MLNVGIVLGRFLPLHPGHLQLFERILKENNIMIVIIGSAQLKGDNNSWTWRDRQRLINWQVDGLRKLDKRTHVSLLHDPTDMETWPVVFDHLVERIIKLKGFSIDQIWHRTFYRSDRLPKRFADQLKQLGYHIRYVKRQPFYYPMPDGHYYKFSSATELKQALVAMEIPPSRELTY